MTNPPRVRIYDLDNRLLGQVRCTANRSYMLNEAGRCELEIAVNQLPNRDDVGVLFKPFNKVLVENENHEPWVGYIEGTADWTGTGVVTFWAEGAEGLLRYADPQDFSLYSGFFGGLSTGQEWTLNNEIGQLQDWGDDFGTESLYDALAEYFDDRNDDWGMTHLLGSDGSIQLVLNFWDRRGTVTDIILEESRNVELHSGTVLSTEGPVYNRVRMYGDGATWATRTQVNRGYKPSEDLFGRRVKILKEEYTTQKKLARVADDFLRGNAAPRLKLALTVTDSSLFDSILLGDFVWVQMHSVGFGPDYRIGFFDKLRVIGKEHNEMAGTMPIIVENDLLTWYRLNS